MATLDMRKELGKDEITEIQFDGSTDRIIGNSEGIELGGGGGMICSYEDLDCFFAACKKAKELWD